jgi:hypothetical protein
VLPSARISKRGSNKSITSRKNETLDEIGAVIDFMSIKQSKLKDGARTP